MDRSFVLKYNSITHNIYVTITIMTDFVDTYLDTHSEIKDTNTDNKDIEIKDTDKNTNKSKAYDNDNDKEYVMNNHQNLDMNDYLFHFKFTEHELEKFIHFVSLRRVLKTQNLSISFVVRHILNPTKGYSYLDDYDDWLTIEDVLHAQPHINKDELEKSIELFKIKSKLNQNKLQIKINAS